MAIKPVGVTEFDLVTVDFHSFNLMRLTAEAMLKSRQSSPNLTLVTHTVERLHPYNRATVLSVRDLQGLAMVQPDKSTQIWLDPNLYALTSRLTLLHELAHVYVGPTRGHGATWRSFYLRLLIHYSTFFGLTGFDTFDPRKVGLSTMKTYKRANDWHARRDEWQEEVEKICRYAEHEQFAIFEKLRGTFA